MTKSLEALKPGKYAILYLDNWDGEGDTYHTLANLEADGRWLDNESGKQLLEYKGDEILKAWPLDDGFETLALIAALEQSQQDSKVQSETIANLTEIWNDGRLRIAELESLCVNPDAAMRGVEPLCVKLPGTKCIGWVKEAIHEHDEKWIEAIRAAGGIVEGSER